MRKGEVEGDLSWLAPWNNELRSMNDGKRGRPFRFPHSHIKLIIFARDVWGLALRQAEGVLRVLCAVLRFEAPDYTTLWRHKVDDELVVPEGKEHVLAVDVGTGTVVATTGTTGRKGDASQLPTMIEQATERLDGHIVAVLVDGAYDTRANFDLLAKRDVEPTMRMRKNANTKRRRGSAARPLAINERNFLGEDLKSKIDSLRMREAQRKAIAYNKLLMA